MNLSLRLAALAVAATLIFSTAALAQDNTPEPGTDPGGLTQIDGPILDEPNGGGNDGLVCPGLHCDKTGVGDDESGGDETPPPPNYTGECSAIGWQGGGPNDGLLHNAHFVFTGPGVLPWDTQITLVFSDGTTLTGQAEVDHQPGDVSNWPNAFPNGAPDGLTCVVVFG